MESKRRQKLSQTTATLFSRSCSAARKALRDRPRLRCRTILRLRQPPQRFQPRTDPPLAAHRMAAAHVFQLLRGRLQIGKLQVGFQRPEMSPSSCRPIANNRRYRERSLLALNQLFNLHQIIACHPAASFEKRWPTRQSIAPRTRSRSAVQASALLAFGDLLRRHVERLPQVAHRPPQTVHRPAQSRPATRSPHDHPVWPPASSSRAPAATLAERTFQRCWPPARSR